MWRIVGVSPTTALVNILAILVIIVLILLFVANPIIGFVILILLFGWGGGGGRFGREKDTEVWFLDGGNDCSTN